MTKIIGFSGKKGAGKDSCANFILGWAMQSGGIVKGEFSLTLQGKLHISDIDGNEDYAGVFDVRRQTESMQRFLEERLNPFIRLYSFADLLKQDICINILNLSYEQCYGTDDDKNSLTHIKWEDIPGTYEKTGFMTGREVLQVVGTDIFRGMYSTVWADSLIRSIQSHGTMLAVISDVRFPDEAKAIQDFGGFVIRLTRNPHKEDEHKSEKALDQENFDWNNFDLIIDNANMNIHQQNTAIYSLLNSLNLMYEGPPKKKKKKKKEKAKRPETSTQVKK